MSGYNTLGDITITVERLTPAQSGPTGLGFLGELVGVDVMTISMDPVTQQIQQAVTKVLTDMLEDLVVKTVGPVEIFGVRLSAERLRVLSGAQIVDFLDGIEQALEGHFSVTVSPLDALDAVRKALRAPLGATAAQPHTSPLRRVTQKKTSGALRTARGIDGFEGMSTDGVELLAVVRETPDGNVYADFQVNASSAQGQGQRGLHLWAKQRTRENSDGTERQVTNVLRELRRDQYDSIKQAAGDNVLTLDSGQIVYGFAADVEGAAPPQGIGQFQPRLNTAQSSSLDKPTAKTLAKQRAAEAKALDDVAEDRLDKVSPSTRKVETNRRLWQAIGETNRGRGARAVGKTQTKKAGLKPSERLAATIRRENERGRGESLSR